MVDDLTRQSVSTLKALGDASIEGIKLTAALLNLLSQKISDCKTEEDKNNCIEDFNTKANDLLKGKMPSGEFSKAVKDSVVMDIPDSVVADMFETELNFQKFDYSRMSDKSFVIRSGDVDVLNHVVQDTAIKLDSMKELPKEQIKMHAKEELKLAQKGKTKEKVEKRMQTKDSVKAVVKNLKEKSKTYNRQREKQKSKDRQTER